MAENNLSFKTAFKKFLVPVASNDASKPKTYEEDQEVDYSLKVLSEDDSTGVNKINPLKDLVLLEEERVKVWELKKREKEEQLSYFRENESENYEYNPFNDSGKDQNVSIIKIKDFYEPTPSRKIVVSYLSCYTEEIDLERYFKKFGNIKSCFIMRDQKTGKSLCSGYLIFERADDGDEVIRYSNHEIEGRQVLVTQPTNDSYEPILSRKVVVRYLGHSATEYNLQQYFKQFGTIESCVIMKNRKNRASLCYGYLIFETADVACEVLKTPQHDIVDREVLVSRPTNESLESEENRTMYISNLDYDTCEDTVMYYFGVYGLVETCVIIRERNDSRKSKGFGFVIFNNAEILAKALAEEPHEIDSRTISCCPEMDSLKIDRTIFLTSLDESVSKDAVINHFSKYGVVETCTITQTGTTGRCKGFLIFQHNEMMAKALSDKSHRIGNKTIMCVPKENKENEYKRTIYIKDFHLGTTEETLIRYFSNYGPVKKCFISRSERNRQKGNHSYKKSGLNRNLNSEKNENLYGCLVFNRYVKMTKLLSDRPHKIDGRKISCLLKRQRPDPLELIQQARTFKSPEPIKINDYYGCGIDVFKMNQAQRSSEIVKEAKCLEGQVGNFPNLPPSQPTLPLSERWDMWLDDENCTNNY